MSEGTSPVTGIGILSCRQKLMEEFHLSDFVVKGIIQ
jgi:hypothetical protein